MVGAVLTLGIVSSLPNHWWIVVHGRTQNTGGTQNKLKYLVAEFLEGAGVVFHGPFDTEREAATTTDCGNVTTADKRKSWVKRPRKPLYLWSKVDGSWRREPKLTQGQVIAWLHGGDSWKGDRYSSLFKNCQNYAELMYKVVPTESAHIDIFSKVLKDAIYDKNGPGPEPEEPSKPEAPREPIRPKDADVAQCKEFEESHKLWTEASAEYQKLHDQWVFNFEHWEQDYRRWEEKRRDISDKIRNSVTSTMDSGGVVYLGLNVVAEMRDSEFVLAFASELEEQAAKLGWRIDGDWSLRKFDQGMSKLHYLKARAR